MIVIYIQNVIGKTFTVKVELDYTMKRVKELICDKEGYPVEEQKLSVDGKEVQDDIEFTHYYMHAEMFFKLEVKGQQDRL
jgi:hypothetical protein